MCCRKRSLIHHGDEVVVCNRHQLPIVGHRQCVSRRVLIKVYSVGGKDSDRLVVPCPSFSYSTDMSSDVKVVTKSCTSAPLAHVPLSHAKFKRQLRSGKGTEEMWSWGSHWYKMLVVEFKK